MGTLGRLVPAGLSLVLLAAHFLRRGALLPMAICLALLALLWVRRPWSAHALRLGLALGVLEWLRTAATLSAERRALGEPVARMVVILGAVIALALLGLALLEGATLRRRFGRAGSPWR